MCQRDDFEVVGVHTIHKQKREVPKRHAANGAASANAAHCFTNRGTG